MFGSTHLIQDTVLAALKFFSVCNPCPEDVLPHVTLLLCIMLVQWCTILSVSGHRSIKPTGIRTLVRSRYSSGGLVSHFFLQCCGQAQLLLLSHQLQASGQCRTPVDVLTSASGPLGHPVLAEVSGHVLHSESALCFVGIIAEPRVNSWSETSLQQLFQSEISQWTSKFHVLFTTMDFFSSRSGVLLFLHDQDAVLTPIKFGLQDTLSCKVLKNCATLLVSCFFHAV